jgi:hypothetical protein
MQYEPYGEEADSLPFTYIKVNGIVYDLDTMHQADWDIDIHKEYVHPERRESLLNIAYYFITAVSPCKNISMMAQVDCGGCPVWEVLTPTDHYNNYITTDTLYDILLSRAKYKKKPKKADIISLNTDINKQKEVNYEKTA